MLVPGVQHSDSVLFQVLFPYRLLQIIDCSSLCYTVGEGNGNPLQYYCLENPMDGGAWWTAVHGVTKSQTGLSYFTFTFHFHALEKEMATHSSVPAWRIPGMAEPGGLPSMGSHRVGHDWSDLAAAAAACYTVGACWLFVFYVWTVLSCFHCVQFFVTLWTIAYQVPLFMGFCRQEYWSGLPCPPLGDLLGWGIEPASLMSPASSGRFFTTSITWEAHLFHIEVCIC